MRYRQFGRTGWQVRELGYEMWGMGNGARVPSGKGVSSSAALEVATRQAVAAAFGVQVDRLSNHRPVA